MLSSSDVVGRYVCSGYIGTANENDYHHVAITRSANGNQQQSYRWKNRAGISWSLSYDPGQQQGQAFLQVGSDCPYYSKGHTKCTLERDGEGRIVALRGPGNERYEKLPPEPRPAIHIQAPTGKTINNTTEDEQRHTFILAVPPSSTDAAKAAHWTDLAFLAAIPASACLNQGRPTVLLYNVSNDGEEDISNKIDDAEIIGDFLSRYQPTEVSILHHNSSDGAIRIVVDQEEDTGKDKKKLHHKKSSDSASTSIRHQMMKDLHTTTIAVAKAAWPSTPKTVVTVLEEDYSAALLASSLAARIRAPLFFVGVDAWNKDVLNQVRKEYSSANVLFVRGDDNTEKEAPPWMSQQLSEGGPTRNVVSIEGVTGAIKWLDSQGYPPIDYLAVANPNDRTADVVSQKLSLTAPVYAARRGGLVVPVVNPISATKTTTAIHCDPRTLDHTLRYLGNVIHEKSSPPEHVVLVGGFDVVPAWQTNSDCNNNKSFAVSDIPYGNLGSILYDEDHDDKKNPHECHRKKFRDIAIGRIFAESPLCGSLLAARTVNYELLLDRRWATIILEAGTWGFPEVSSLFRIAGIGESPGRHVRKIDMEQARLVEAAAFLHKDHSSAMGLGNFVSCRTECLYAPSIVVTRGCHGAGIDEGFQCDGGTVAGRMLGRGCVCYVGSSRSPTSANTLTEVAFFQELLYGESEQPMTVGRAMKTAFNKSLVNHLDGGVMNNYCLENEVLLGDPALVPCFAKRGTAYTKVGASLRTRAVVTSASHSYHESGFVTFVGPSEWKLTPIHQDQLAEWKYKGDLFTYVAPCVEQETVWCGRGYDVQELYYVVSVVLPKGMNVQAVKALDSTEAAGSSSAVTRHESSEWTKRWWRSGQHFVQHNNDGSTTVRWRLRLLDYDMETGAIRAELKSAHFQLIFN